ncbi:MAG: hypothetical protein WAX04_05210 [Oscillospiraceae bacterium]
MYSRWFLTFTNRIVDVWNGLPEEVVSANNVNIFKNRLDKFWINQELLYNWKSNIAGTGSRSEVSNEVKKSPTLILIGA